MTENIPKDFFAGAQFIDHAGNLPGHEAAVFQVALLGGPAQGTDGQVLDFLKGSPGALLLNDLFSGAVFNLAGSRAPEDLAGEGGIRILGLLNQPCLSFMHLELLGG